jgi:PAS domain S-box-containing protein
MQEVFMQACINKESAWAWYRIFSVYTNFIGVTGLHFVLVFINKGKWQAKSHHIVLLYLPTFLFSMFFSSKADYMTFESAGAWGWVCTPSHPISILAFISIGVHAFMILFLLIRYTYKMRLENEYEYKRSRIILIGSILPILLGCVYQIILPVFFNYTPIPIASSFVIFFSISILIAITRYKFFEYSPVYQWEGIVQHMNQGILIVDRKQTIKYVNDKLCSMFGYWAADLINHNLNDFFELNKDRESAGRLTKQKEELFKSQYPLILKKKTGEKMICDVDAQPYLDSQNTIMGTIIIITDVTAQKNAEKRIKESESRYRSFVENATDAIFVCDKQGNYIDVNKKACQLLEYTQEELCVMNFKEILFNNDADVLSPTKTAREKNSLVLKELKSKNGVIVSTEINSRLLPDGNIISIVRDITDRKKTEAALLQKVKEMDAFIYRASHDLRGPLASISGLVMVGKNEIKNQQADSYFDKIQDTINRLDTIIQELSKIARVTQAQLSYSTINMEIEMDDLLNSLSSLPGFSEVVFKRKINVAYFVCDRILLIIILQNLIINSINYADGAKAERYISLSTTDCKTDIELTVSDNGIGMAADIQPKVFDMFYRGTSVSKGSGLGMYIVMNAVKRLNGTIRFCSEEGIGTTVSVLLPKKTVA